MLILRRPPGASEDYLAKLEASYSVQVPAALRTLWLWSDGPILWFGFKELQFLRIEEILDDIYSVRFSMPGALPLCLDGMSNICVARIESGRVEGYYVAACGNLGWEESRRIADSFDLFLQDHLAPEKRLHV